MHRAEKEELQKKIVNKEVLLFLLIRPLLFCLIFRVFGRLSLRNTDGLGITV